MNTVRAEITYCDTCGGLKNVTFPIAQTKGMEPARAFQPFTYTLCPGHPMPKHDGRLGGEEHEAQTVDYRQLGHGHTYISLRYDDSSRREDDIWLSPKQALSLLAWLKQEEQTLQELAKEQETDV